MSFGSDSPGGAPEGIGGDESGIGGIDTSSEGGFGGLGIGNPGSYGGVTSVGAPGFFGLDSGPSYTEQALMEAMLQSQAQERDNAFERALAFNDVNKSEDIADMMDRYMDRGEDEKTTLANELQDKNFSHDLSKRSLPELVTTYKTMTELEQPMDAYWEAVKQKVSRGILDFTATNTLNAIGLGKFGTDIANWGFDRGLADLTDQALDIGFFSPLPEDYYGANTTEIGDPEVDVLLAELVKPSRHVQG